jgi:CHAT domain-containing protein
VTAQLSPEAIAKPHLASSLANYDILHFAAHSTADNQYPWRSAIHLAAPGSTTQGTILRAAEIAGWKLPARLVVLSSCQSAGGRVLSGEGVQGLTSAFLSAGAQAVLATLWPVDDQITAEFMGQFYRSLEKGESLATSLKQAQVALHREPRTAHPFYWASFVLVGEGNLRLNLTRRSNPLPFVGLGVILTMVIGLAVRAVREKKRGTL